MQLRTVLLLAFLALLTGSALSQTTPDSSTSSSNDDPPPCSAVSVTDQASCNAACEGTGSAGVYESTERVSCKCQDVSETRICRDDDSSGDSHSSPATYDDALALALAATPDICHTTIRNVFTRRLFNCAFTDNDDSDSLDDIFEAEFELEDEHFNLTSTINSAVCENMCLGEIVHAFAVLQNDAPLECIQSLPFEIETESFAELQPYLQLYCAQGGMGFCGALAESFNGYLINGTEAITMDTCNQFNMYGRCLGNFVAFRNEEMEGEGDEVAMNLTMTCMTSYSIDISASTSGTEAAATLSSATATLASASVALVALVLALLF